MRMQLVPALLGLILLAWLVCESHQQFGLRLGPYDLTVQQAYACEDQGNGISKLNISLYLGPPDAARKRKRLHKGSFSWPFNKKEMERMVIEAEFYQKKSSDFLLMLKHNDNFCTSMQLIESSFYSSFQKAIGIKVGGCEIPGGNYTFEDWEIPLTIPTPMLEYGAYKTIVRFIADKGTFGCVTVLADVKPKPRPILAIGSSLFG